MAHERQDISTVITRVAALQPTIAAIGHEGRTSSRTVEPVALAVADFAPTIGRIVEGAAPGHTGGATADAVLADLARRTPTLHQLVGQFRP